MKFDGSPEFEQSPAKMFLGLFVLIAVMAGGFLVVRLVGTPETEVPRHDSSVVGKEDGDSSRSNFGVSDRDPDGELRNDPLGSDDFDVEMQPPKTGEKNDVFDYPPDRKIDR